MYIKTNIGKALAFKLIIIISLIRNAIQFNCPLLHSFTDNSGILSVNKNLVSYSELPIQCQWLIGSSPHQVVKLDLLSFKSESENVLF